jgi:hypothetical protein
MLCDKLSHPHMIPLDGFYTITKGHALKILLSEVDSSSYLGPEARELTFRPTETESIEFGVFNGVLSVITVQFVMEKTARTVKHLKSAQYYPVYRISSFAVVEV